MKYRLTHDEQGFLEKVRHTYNLVGESSHEQMMRNLSIRVFAPYIKGGRGLELGCADGYITEQLAGYFESLDVVDGSSGFLASVRNRQLPNVKPICSLFEDFVPTTTYEAVFASYILEHVADPQALLRMSRASLGAGGFLFVVVPNANALSRQLARQMGLINELTDLTENDLNHGHRRVYDRVNLNRELESAGLRSVAQGGILLKPLADFQMEKLIALGVLGVEQIEGLFKLGLEYPHLCGSLYSICQAC